MSGFRVDQVAGEFLRIKSADHDHCDPDHAAHRPRRSCSPAGHHGAAAGVGALESTVDLAAVPDRLVLGGEELAVVHQRFHDRYHIKAGLEI
jgi:hypothetical protein